MGKRARATARKPRGAIRSADDADNGIVVAGDDAGNTAAVAGGGDTVNTAGGSIVDPGNIGNPGSTDDNGSGNSAASGGNVDPVTGKRRYKRRAAKASPDAVSLEIGSFKDILYSTHAMIASIASAPGVAIDDDEAEKLAKAIGNVTRHYEVPSMAQSTLDWIMLIQACGAVYGPRLLAWKMERAARRVKPAPQSPMAPRNVAPAPTAPNADTIRPGGFVSAASPGVSERATPTNGAMPTAPARNQPGISTLDGSDLPLKLN